MTNTNFAAVPLRNGPYAVARHGRYQLAPRFAEPLTAAVFAAWCDVHFETEVALAPAEALDVAQQLTAWMEQWRDADLGVTLSPAELAATFRAERTTAELAERWART